MHLYLYERVEIRRQAGSRSTKTGSRDIFATFVFVFVYVCVCICIWIISTGCVYVFVFVKILNKKVSRKSFSQNWIPGGL